MGTKRRLRGEARKTILAVAPYLYRHRARMRYDEHLVAGLPIASGAVEGRARTSSKIAWSALRDALDRGQRRVLLKPRAQALLN